VYSVVTKCEIYEIKSNLSNKLYYSAPKVDQTAGHISLPHAGITKTEKNRTKTEKKN